MKRSDVLIVGAGPTGLILALWLIKQRVQVRIIDKTAGPGTTSRALAVQARTLELYRQLDLTTEVLHRGHKLAGLNLWVKGSRKAHIAFDTLAQDLTPYGPFIYPQDQHECFLIERLAALGVAVERNTELLSFTENSEYVTATLRGPEHSEYVCEARYLAACDGASSIIRKTLGIGFPGGTYNQVFYVADIEADGPAMDGELHIELDESDFLAIFPLKGEGRARLIGTVRGERAERAETLTFDDVGNRAIEHMKVQIKKVNWFSSYRVHHRVAQQFRKGRTFLLGDAAHIHSPAGGQGMNTGIGDAINLAWKLKAVLAGEASDALLETYEVERRAFAKKLVATTDRGFTLASAEGRMADFIRTRVIPFIVPRLFEFKATRNRMFRAVTQISLTYHDSALSEGKAGAIRGGDRLPWAPAQSTDNFHSFQIISWKVHVYGVPQVSLSGWCERHHIRLDCFDWNEAHARAGLVRNAMYLLRPDSYIAMAAVEQNPELISRYFASRALRLPESSLPDV